MNDAKMTPHQLHLEVLKVMGWRCEITESHILKIRKAVWFNPSGKEDFTPPLTLDLMWQAIHPDKPLDEEITRQAKEFLKLQNENRSR